MNSKNQAVLQTIIINTTHMKTLADFYGQGFEFGPTSVTGEDHLGWDLPNLYLGFDQVAEKPAAYPGAISLWFEVDDLDAVFNRFVEMGAKIKHKPAIKSWGATLAAVFDPDGNVVGLAQR
jgi:predicted enzyme related to lactoylglutathione lyase